jgi:hypothetical protein
MATNNQEKYKVETTMCMFIVNAQTGATGLRRINKSFGNKRR